MRMQQKCGIQRWHFTTQMKWRKQRWYGYLFYLPRLGIDQLACFQLDKKSVITVDRNSSFTVSGIHHLYNEHKYSGISNMLTLSRVYTTSFTCKFNMAHYPFDVQTCTMTFIPQVIQLIHFNVFSISNFNLRATTEILQSLRRDSFVTWDQLICLNITSKV